MTRSLLVLALLLALPAQAAAPAKRAEAPAAVAKLGSWKVICAAAPVRRCTLARGYLPPILELDERGTRLVADGAPAACHQPWRYRLDGRDLAAIPAADRAKALLGGNELARERPMGRRCKMRRERVNIAGIGAASRLLAETFERTRPPAPGRPAPVAARRP